MSKRACRQDVETGCMCNRRSVLLGIRETYDGVVLYGDSVGSLVPRRRGNGWGDVEGACCPTGGREVMGKSRAVAV